MELIFCLGLAEGKIAGMEGGIAAQIITIKQTRTNTDAGFTPNYDEMIYFLITLKVLVLLSLVVAFTT